MIEFQFSDFFYPADLAKTMLLLWRSEHWGSEQFEAYQRRQLTRLMKYSYRQVPYYAALFQSLGIDEKALTEDVVWEVFRKIPVLDKATLQQTPDAFVSKIADQYNPKMITTSGTTGTPLTVYWDRDSNVMEFCCIQRLWRWGHFWPGQPFLDLRSRGIFGESHHHYVKDGDIAYLYNWKIRGLEFSSDMIDEHNINAYYKVLLRYKPRLVRGHPQSIQHLAHLMQKNELTGWHPKSVTTASETLYDFQRQEIMAAWNAPILDSYGLKEHNIFITQCEAGSYHIYPEYGICEIVDDDGRQVAPGEEGWVVATGLHNYAQVLFRYNTRDRAIAGSGHRCACGRTLPTIERLIGRIDDCMYAQDGHRYSGFSFAFLDRQGIRKGRLIQEDYNRVRVELVVNELFTEDEKNKLLLDLNQKVRNQMHFELAYVDDIQQETAGKFKFVVSKVKPKAK